jgi:putative ATPase
MLEAGEDPRFIARRLIIAASEDVGNADPHALQVAVAAAGALEWVGLPEAQYALAHATAYVAAAPKSNRAGVAYWAAMDDVLRHGSLPVPSHLRSATWREKRDFGHGKGYVYPHDFVGADVDQQYLPERLAGRRYYVPSDHGYEKVISDRMAARLAAREAAAAAGGPQRDSDAPRKGDGMKVAGNVMAKRDERKRTVAARQKREASAPPDEGSGTG